MKEREKRSEGRRTGLIHLLVLVLLAFSLLPINISLVADNAKADGINIPPVAIAKPPTQTINVGEEAWFSGNESYDTDGYIVSYDWYFGDGTNGTGVNISHVYTTAGNYTVKLIVTDNGSLTDNDTCNVVVMEAPLPPPPSDDDWTMFNHDPQHIGFSTSEAPDNANITWTFTGLAPLTSPSIADGMVFVADWEPMLSALNESTGATIWSYELPGNIPSQPVIANGKVFVNVFEWGNLSDWMNKTDVVHIYCFDEFTGGLLWEWNTTTLNLPPLLSPWFQASPITAVNNRLYFGLSAISYYNASEIDMIICLNESTGEIMWNVNVTEYDLSYSYTPLTIANGMIFVSCWDRLYALDENNGDLLWTFRDNGTFTFNSAPVVANGKVFIGRDRSNQFYCLNESTGSILWQTSLFSNYIYTTSAVAYGKVFVGANDYSTNVDPIFALDENTGDILWIYNTTTAVVSSPAVADNKVFNSYFDGTICALDESSGKVVWIYKIQYPSRSYHQSLAIAYGKLFVSTLDELYAFGPGGPGNQPPIAIAEPYLQIVNVGEEAWFSGILSYDPDGYIVSWDWDFGDGTNGTGVNTTHNYTLPGCYFVTLTVTDNGSATDSDQVIVLVENGSITGNIPPVAIAEPPMQIVNLGEEAWFNGSLSYDPDGYIVSWDWDFGDGTNGTGVNTTHNYTLPGGYIVIMTVTDNGSATNSTFVLVIVEEGPPPGNLPPVAIAEPPFQIVNVGEDAWFSGNLSFDPDGFIVSYDWDFGDGTNGSGIWVTHNYTVAETYNVNLTVTDNDGATDTDCVLVIVEDGGPPPGNLPPVAIAEPPFQIVNVGEEAWFSGNLSFDPDGFIVSYDWDFGDGTNGRGMWITHNYTIAGNYNVTLTVTDNDGATDSCVVFVLVEDGGPPPGNLPPVAIAEPPFQIVNVGEDAWFSGNMSFDPDGFIVSYDWDFGDGTNGSGMWVTHKYTMAGNYNVTLTVTDNDGATDSCLVFVLVEDGGPPPGNQPPVAIAEPLIQIVYIGDEAWFSGNLSYDPDGYIVSWDWDFGDGTNGSGETITHVYTMLGNYTVTLTVTDNGGLSDSDWVFVIVVGNETNPVILRTDPADGEVGVPLNYSITVVFSNKMDPTTLNWTIDPDPGGWTEAWSMDTTVLKLIHSNPFDLSTVYEVEIVDVKDIDGYPLVPGPVPNPWQFVTVGENLPPVAIAIPEIQYVYVGEEALFDGSLSYDLDGFIVNYSWDFGDGSVGNGIWVTHNYTVAETYNVNLTVTDDYGATDTDCVLVIVEEGPPPGNLPPVAIAEPPFQMVNVGEEAWFSGNWSFDPDGYIVSWDWDFGDGTNGSGMWVTHKYTMGGTYNVTLTVTDNDGATDSCVVFVLVEDGGPPPKNQPPVAIAEPPIQIVNIGEEAWFSGNLSYDPDGYIVSWDWDFGDGTNGTGVTITHVYTNTGSYLVTLTVTDNNGATDTDTVMVMVQEPPIPNRSPVADAGKDRFADPFEELIFNGNGSFDLDGTIVSYQWDFGDGGSAAGMVVKHTYTDYKTYIVTLEVVDDEGATDTETCIVFVENQNISEEKMEHKLPIPGPIEPKEPMLILTAGLINMATFEDEIEKMIPVEVTAYYDNVYNVHIELIDDGGLDIEIIPIVQDVPEGRIVRFFLKIKGPELPDDLRSTGITIKLKAVGDGMESNIEHVDVIVREEKEESSSGSDVTVISTMGTISIAAILAAIIGRRLL